jgi:hypothetical protein
MITYDNNVNVLGVISLYTAEQRVFFNWSTGREERVDNNVLITAGAAPHYGFKGTSLMAVHFNCPPYLD